MRPFNIVGPRPVMTIECYLTVNHVPRPSKSENSIKSHPLDDSPASPSIVAASGGGSVSDNFA